jgi:hypothetical protein
VRSLRGRHPRARTRPAPPRPVTPAVGPGSSRSAAARRTAAWRRRRTRPAQRPAAAGLHRQVPAPTRSTTRGGEDLRVPSHQGAVSSRRPHDPDQGNPSRRNAPARRREGLRVRSLALARPRGSADIADRVPAFHQDEEPAGVVEQADVGRAPWLGRPCRELEARRVARRAAEPEHQLLHGQVAGVRGLPGRGSLECHREWSVDRQPDPLPGIEGEAAAEAALGPADRLAAQPDAIAQRLLGESLGCSAGAELTPDTSALLAVAAFGLDGETGADAGRHGRSMILSGTYRPLTGGPAAAVRPPEVRRDGLTGRCSWTGHGGPQDGGDGP